MDSGRSPAVLPVCSMLAGAELAQSAAHGSVPAAAALVGLGLALRSRVGSVVAFAALGLLLVWREPVGTLDGGFPRLDLPVSVNLRLRGHWRREEFGWSVRARCDSIRQRNRVERRRPIVYLSIPGDARPPPGTRLRAVGYLRRQPAFANGGRSRAAALRLNLKSRRFLESLNGAGRWPAPARRAREAVEGVFDGATRWSIGLHVGKALLLGEARAVPLTIRRSLRRSGLAHLLAVSGLHVGLVAALATLLGSALPRGTRGVPALLSIVLYLAVVGPRPAILRATGMVVLVWAALRLERRPLLMNSLALALGMQVAWSPEVMRDLGFQLTAMATAGILVLGPTFAARWSGVPTCLRRGVAATAAAQLATLPLTVPTFGMLSPMAPLLNLVAIPWTALMLAASLLWAVVALVAPGTADRLVAVLDLLALPYTWLPTLPVHSWLPVLLDIGPFGALALSAAVSAALVWRWRRLAMLAALVLLSVSLLRAPRAPRSPELVMIDVGQGDAVLLRDGPAAVLIDGGGWRSGDFGGRVLVPALARLGARRLQAVVLTHPDADHCRGLLDLTSYVPIGEVWTGPGWPGNECRRALVGQPAVGLRILWAGDAAAVGRWRLSVLGPSPLSRAGTNDRSLVIRAEALGFRALLTGDIEATGERRLVARYGTDLRAELLKVAHHGSSSSTSAPLLAAVAPRLALISAGAGNRYGHPSGEVLRRLFRRSVPVLRTDRDGQVRVRIEADGRVKVTTPAAPSGWLEQR